ncbi:MAG: hypothetical protein NC191_04855 [Muribaculaceae bacterium]|nr:hypothetical protein [Muribaculaceae bacterium]
MKLLPITSRYTSVTFNGQNSNRKNESGESRIVNQHSTIDALRKQLMNLAIGSMMLVGATGATSCITDEPDSSSDIYTVQCPRVDTPVKSMDGLLPKADYMMQLLGLLPEHTSILDVSKIETTDIETGNTILMQPRKESDENKIIMDYTKIMPDGSEAYSTYEMYDNGYGYITCILKKAEGIDGSHKRYTQSTTDFKNLAEYTANNGLSQTAIIKRTKDGLIKKINPDNSAKYYKVNVELKN